MHCKRVDVEVFASRDLAYCLLLLEFLAFVPQGHRGNACGLPTLRVSRGTPAKVSGLAPRWGPLRFAGRPQVLAEPSGGPRTNVSGGALITYTRRWQRRGIQRPEPGDSNVI